MARRLRSCDEATVRPAGRSNSGRCRWPVPSGVLPCGQWPGLPQCSLSVAGWWGSRPSRSAVVELMGMMTRARRVALDREVFKACGEPDLTVTTGRCTMMTTGLARVARRRPDRPMTRVASRRAARSDGSSRVRPPSGPSGPGPARPPGPHWLVVAPVASPATETIPASIEPHPRRPVVVVAPAIPTAKPQPTEASSAPLQAPEACRRCVNRPGRTRW